MINYLLRRGVRVTGSVWLDIGCTKRVSDLFAERGLTQAARDRACRWHWRIRWVFRSQGLEVVTRDFPAGARALQAVHDGAADVFSGAFEHALRAHARGRL